jgi:hypothetical protein
MPKISASEREKMLAVRFCRPRVIARLESIGMTNLIAAARESAAK